MNWVIYVLKDPRTQAVRYVGFTSKNPARRLRAHIEKAAREGGRTLKHKWLASLAECGLAPDLEIAESGVGDTWAEAERRWIAHYRANGARLVNVTDGARIFSFT